MHLDLVRSLFWTLAAFAFVPFLAGLVSRRTRKDFGGALIAAGVGCGLITVFWLIRAVVESLAIRMVAFNVGLMFAVSFLFVVAGGLYSLSPRASDLN